MESTGLVREYDPINGVGVIDSPDTPGGCWVHSSRIAMDGYRTLRVGERVAFTFEPFPQNGFAYRALEVRRNAQDTLPPPRSADGKSGPSPYTSELTIYPGDQ